MATNAAGSPDGDPPAPDGKGGNPKDKDFIPLSQHERELGEATERRDLALQRAQKAESRLKEIDDAETKRKADEAVKNGASEELRKTLEAETKAERDKREIAEKRTKDLLMDRDAKSALFKISTDPDVAYMLLKDDLEIAERDGKEYVRPKNSTKSVEEWAEERLATLGKEYLLKSKRVAGSGAQAAEGANPGAQQKLKTKEEIQAMGRDQRVLYLARNPDARKLIDG